MSDPYEDDIAAWSERQADALRRRASNEIDWDNVAEEIESLGRSDRREIRNRLAVICEHLLKWQFQPEQRSGSWRGFVIEQRTRIAGLIEESPSLTSYPASVLTRAYADGRAKAAAETDLLDLPDACPWTVPQLLDPEFWPMDEELKR
jgi:hypothetical protein